MSNKLNLIYLISYLQYAFLNDVEAAYFSHFHFHQNNDRFHIPAHNVKQVAAICYNFFKTQWSADLFSSFFSNLSKCSETATTKLTNWPCREF